MRRALAALMLLTGCTCTSEKELAEIEEPIEAEIVWRTVRGVEWAGGGHYVVVPTGIGKKESAFLKAEGYDDRPLHEWSWSKETPVELVSDETGGRLGYREAGGEWRVAYLLAPEHVFLTDVRRAALDWSKVPDFSGAAVELFTARDLNRQDCVLDEVEKRGGSSAVADVLIRTVNVASAKAWDEAFDELGKPEQARVTAELRKELEKRAPAPALSRALRRLKLGDPKLAPALFDLTRQHARAFAASKQHLVGEKDFAILLRASAALRPSETAPLACAAIDDGRSMEVSAAGFVALTRAGKSCEPAENVLKEKLCTPELACALDPELGETTCQRKRFAELARRELEADASETADEAIYVDAYHQRIALWASRIPSPPALFTRLRERHRYPVDSGGERTCRLATRSDEPCRCNEAEIRAALCRVADGTEGETRWCRFRADDGSRRIRAVRAKRAGAWRSVAGASTAALGGYAVLCGVAGDGGMQCRPWPRLDQEREPIAAPGIEDARAVALSAKLFCALGGDGSVWCTTPERDRDGGTLSPAQKIALPERADGIAASRDRVCARLTNGRPACFADAGGEQLDSLALADVARIDGAWDAVALVDRRGRGSLFRCVRAACGLRAAPWPALERLWPGAEWSFARLPDGRVQAAPTRAISDSDAGSVRIESIAGIDRAQSVAGGRDGGCALLDTGDVRCWTREAMSDVPVAKTATSLVALEADVSGTRFAATLADGSLVLWESAEKGIGTPRAAD